jgi:hypothetical protein
VIHGNARHCYWGHTEDESNLKRLLLLHAHEAPELRIWLSRTQYQYIYHDVVNEMLEIMAHAVVRSLLEQVRKVNFQTIMMRRQILLLRNRRRSVSDLRYSKPMNWFFMSCNCKYRWWNIVQSCVGNTVAFWYINDSLSWTSCRHMSYWVLVSHLCRKYVCVSHRLTEIWKLMLRRRCHFQTPRTVLFSIHPWTSLKLDCNDNIVDLKLSWPTFMFAYYFSGMI